MPIKNDEPQGALATFLDYLLRGQYASVGATRALLEGRPSDIPSEAWKGLSGQTRGSYRDVAEDYGLPAPWLTGFVGDVLLDPITYVPIGGMAKAGYRALPKGVQAAAETGAKAVRDTDLVQWAGRAFNSRFRPKEIPVNEWDDVLKTIDAAKRIRTLEGVRGVKFGKSIDKDIQQLLKSRKITRDQVTDLLASTERRFLMAGLPTEARPVVDKIGRHFRRIDAQRVKLGRASISDADYQYVTRMMSDKGLKSLGKLGLEDAVFKEFTTTTGSDFMRDYMKVISPTGKMEVKHLTKEAADDLIKKGFKVVEADQAEVKKFFPDLFTDDIPKLSMVASERLGRVKAGEYFYKEIQKLGSNAAQVGWVQGGDELGKKWFSRPLYEEITKVHKAFTGDETLRPFLKGFDKLQGVWKKTTLGVFPQFHFRNWIGNMWNNYLAGIPAYAKEYHTAFKIMTSGGKGLSKEEAKWTREAVSHGIFFNTFYRSEGLKEATLTSKAGKAVMKPFEAGLEFGSKVEDHSKLAHYIYKRARGFSPEEAALSVKKYLFDYSDLSMFEKNVLKRLMPFYTWTRKNIPLQVEALINKTGRVLPIEKARKISEKEAGNPRTDLMPDYVRERMPFMTGRKGNEVSYFPLEGFIPFADIQKLVRPQEVPAELLSPFLKVPIEQATNKNFYYEQPIEKYRGETKRFLGMDVPARLEHLGRNIRLLSSIDRFMGKGKLPADAPPQPSTGQNVIREVFGVKTYKYDLQKSKKYLRWQIAQEIGELKSAMKKAKTYGRDKEVQRIMGTLAKMEKEMEKFK